MELFLIYCNIKVAKKSARNSIQNIFFDYKTVFCHNIYKEDIQSFLNEKIFLIYLI